MSCGRGRCWWPLLLWTVGSFLAYAILDVSRYFWYYVPLVPGVMLAVSAGVHWVRAAIARWPAADVYRNALAVLLLIVLFWASVPGAGPLVRGGWKKKAWAPGQVVRHCSNPVVVPGRMKPACWNRSR